jgi:hypothetical protein
MKKLIPLLITITTWLTIPGCVKTIEDNAGNPGTPDPTEVGAPVGGLVSKTIGSDGGSIMSADGNAELIFPAGALDGNTEISIQAITNHAPNGVGMAYRFLPEGTKFTQPVTVKFHYTAEDLAATLAEYMGIAFQDSAGIWIVLKDFTNDSTHKVISCPIKHFTDFTVFDLIELTPKSGVVKVKKTIGLNVSYVEVSEDNDLLALLAPKNPKIIWAVNGNVNGNPNVGTLSGSVYDQTYKAPDKVPAVNPVIVSAEVTLTMNFEGKHYNRLVLTSQITVIDGEKYLLEMRISETIDPFKYTDSVNMIVVIDNENNITVSDIHNFSPNITPPYYRMDPCTVTWEWDAVGETNVSGVTGTISGSNGDPSRALWLDITNTGAVSPKFTQTCDGGDPETEGGFGTSGLPMNAYFTLVPGQKVYETDTGDMYEKLTLIE